MNRALRIALAVALIAGVASSEWLTRSASFRDMIGRICNRGRLLAIASGTGIYETDVPSPTPQAIRSAIVAANVRHSARAEEISHSQIAAGYRLLRAQFGDEQAFARALRANNLSADQMRRLVADQSRSSIWLEQHLASHSPASDASMREYYEAHRSEFVQPRRFRARHLFLAAHAATAADLIETKRRAAERLLQQLRRGADFAQLAAQTSEDETTKNRGGDLGFFAASRMPPEFTKEVAKLRQGETSQVFQSHLGFHIVQLTAVIEPRGMSFGEVREEIANKLANDGRGAAAIQLAENLSGAEFARATR